MSRSALSLAWVAVLLSACSAVGQLTVKNYQAKTGERVLGGRPSLSVNTSARSFRRKPQSGASKAISIARLPPSVSLKPRWMPHPRRARTTFT
jgi:hypothetical protein